MGILSSMVSGVRSRLRSLGRGLRRRETVEADMREEFRHHIELHTERLMAQGMEPGEAARRARLDFGHVEGHREDARAARGLHVFDEVRFSWLDVKLGLRMLRKHPGLSIVALFALAVGIPAGLAPMHLAQVVSAPLPEDPGDRIRAIRYWDNAASSVGPTTAYELERWREELRSFEQLAAVREDVYSLAAPDSRGSRGDGDAGAPVLGAEVTASSFDLLGASPHLGRSLAPSDEGAGAPDVVLLGHQLWQSRLGGDRDVLGRTVEIAGTPHTVVGIMPEGFLFPIRQQLWLPLRRALPSEPGTGRSLRIFGRLAAGASTERAQAELTTVGRRMAEAHPETNARLEPQAVPFALSFWSLPAGGLRQEPGFYFFQLLGLCLLSVACANVAMLLFARTATRSRELAVRTALGASRMRILSQMFAESLVIALAAAALGVAAADWLLARIVDTALSRGTPLPYWLDLGVSAETAGWALGLAVASAVLAGVVPAWRITRAQVQESIQQAKSSRSGVRFGALTSALVVADVAIAVTVVGLAGGLASWVAETRVGADRVGIAAEEYLAAEIDLPRRELAVEAAGGGGDTFQRRLAGIQEGLVERLRREPGVRGVGVASVLPRMDHPSTWVEVEGEEVVAGEPRRSVRLARVAPDYFAELGAPLVQGRSFDWTDEREHASTVIVNTAFVEEVLGGQVPLGRRIRLQPRGSGDGVDAERWYEVVGVVGSLGMALVSSSDAGVYLPAAPGMIQPLRLAIHLAGDPEDFTPILRELLGEVDPVAVVSAPQALGRIHPGDWYLMIAVTGGLILLLTILVALAASGIFAMVSFMVSERTPEIGIRTALGAQRTAIVSLVMKRSLVQLVTGTVLGMPLAYLGLRGILASPVSDAALVLTAGAAVATVVGLAATTAPIRRALAIAPTEALKGID